MRPRASSFLFGASLAAASFFLYVLLSPCPAAPPRTAVSLPSWRTNQMPSDRAAAHRVKKADGRRKPKAAGDGGGDSKVEKLAGPAADHVHVDAETPPPEQDLGSLLVQAAMPDKTVLITAINQAWAAPGSGLDLFLESFRAGDRIDHLVRHLVIVSMDRSAFGRCRSIHHLCYLFTLDDMNFASEQTYMKGDYLEMMWRRNRFQQSILELGYSFLFTDVDILWFRSPFPHISPDAHLIMSTDFFVGDPSSPNNYPNGGLLYAKSCDESIRFYRRWQAERARFPGKHEQYVFDKIVKEGAPAGMNMTVRFLDTAYFGGFCQHGKDLTKICTMHANCCVGLENKLVDLRSVLDDWKRYRGLGGDGGGHSWRVPGRCIH